ncbi:hypothetical protein SAMN05660662_1545 [Blastococcus aurantiacus]|uniref:Uncharacterized protein n=1 Tax=Blastococcus aurantiacus TaxID=1550231 RepID=A0A1G7JJP1_9ACTN|nr:hypothetical protein [Blastococcus aurantiacus]SDF24994.1 hypothetical protein SAMN05660662_1545 [Blastococcus aurantiacus]
MPEDDVCAHGDHRPPAAGGSCPCGMVTRVPAVRQGTTGDTGVRDLIARCLVERGGVADLPELRRRADRVLGALADAGLLVSPRSAAGGVAERRPA